MIATREVVAGYGDGDRGFAPARAALEGLDLYLREIGQTPLLTFEEEVALAQRIEQGDTMAAAAMARANLRLVVSVARRFIYYGVPLEDLIAEGNLGLLHAIQKYEWRRACRFSTYAVWWIRQAIARSVADKARTIRLPVYVGEELSRRHRAMESLSIELGREPTRDERDAALGVDPIYLDAAAVAAQGPLSLDLGLEGNDERLADILPDTTASTPEDEAVRRATTHETRQILRDVLTPREYTLLALRYGLESGSPLTLDVVGRQLGVTRERARQIEQMALTKLRHPTVAARLRAL